MEEAEVAIMVRRARKQFTKNGKLILDNLNMTVMRGTIYGLLGASGCGKTTLLSSIVGMRKLQSGMITVFGQSPCKTSVKSIGYMPQDVALVGEFTVKGALQHYGWIFNMSDEEINERFDFLSKLLDLPHQDKLIKHLSGGQQRRVSLAVVLVHNPDLLILDEPTVGLDPVLRQNIWDYLVKIAEVEKKTIIITTHYIEEANQAHQLGLMRNGKILEEGPPQVLQEKYNCPTIENVFLLLSQKQQQGQLELAEHDTHGNSPGTGTTFDFREQPKKWSFWNRLCFTNRGHAKALMSKNFLRFKRHPGTLMFAFLFPVLQICTFFLAVGKTPEDLKMGIFSEELGNYTDCEDYKAHKYVGGQVVGDNDTCTYNGLSCRFVDNVGSKLPIKVYFKSKEEAIEAVKQGLVNNVIHFPKNYSESVAHIRGGTAVDDFNESEVKSQEIHVYREIIDRSISDVVQKELYDSYARYMETLAVDCRKNPHSERIPILFNDPIYGSKDLTYRDLIAPGMLALVSVFLTMGISTTTITTERTEGVWERTIVAGVSPTEILIFHTLTMCCVSIIQILELFIISFSVFELACKGYKLTVFLLIYIQSITGITFGIFISVITKTVTEANYASLGLFYPFITLTGCFWPIEGMPFYLRYLSYFVPLTITSQAVSNVIHRGWGLTHFHVLKGIFASIGFTCLFTLLSFIVLRREKKI